MADREKVIKGLEGVYRCISPVTHGTCGDCPYQDNHVECIRRVVNDAITLLKEQEAIKPFYKDENFPDYFSKHTLGRCGHCKAPLPAIDGMRSKFCWMCGRQVKWNE